MKFLQLPSFDQTNSLFNKLKQLNPGRSIEFSAYSCKSTKFDKKHRALSKPLRFFISALEMEFINSDFSSERMSSFKVVNMNTLLSEISYVVLTQSKSASDACEFVDYMRSVLESCIDPKHSSIYYYRFETEIYLIYDKKRKRVILIKMVE